MAACAPCCIADDGDFALVSGGTFAMGSPETEAWREKDETAHEVAVSGFLLAKREVSQEEYEKFTGKNPSEFKGKDLPVENVTWFDAVRFCNAKSKAEGLQCAYAIDGEKVVWNREADGYRLSTEAEWEYVPRGKLRAVQFRAGSDRQARQLLRHLPVRRRPIRKVQGQNSPDGLVQTKRMGIFQHARQCGGMVLGHIR